jgi:nucleoporin GLE1
MNSVTLDARELIIRPTNPWVEGVSTQVPGVYVYLLNLLVKLSLKNMPTSASNKAYNAVDPIGIVVCWAFSISAFHIQGNSFADILLAKYHFVCPPLFGIYGSEKTQQGRTRLGWARESSDGGWLSPQLHYDRLAGISVGWAALTLRDFSKSQNRNPLPAWHYWRSLAFILNVPPAQITPSHGIILKGLIEEYARSFFKFYGQLAIVALRTAVVELPAAAAAQNNTALQGVSVLRDTLKAKYDLAL